MTPAAFETGYGVSARYNRSSYRTPLDVFFKPQSVAVVGATEDPSSVGRSIIWNLKNGPFNGKVIPINPKRETVFGLRCYRSIGEAPEKVDLAIIATPAKVVPGIIAECSAASVQGAVIISAGFREVGDRGAALEKEILRAAGPTKLRIVGPNCLGIMSPHYGLNATFAKSMAIPGSVGFISQSGALCTAILDWSLQESVGFSAFVSVGSMLDIGWGDLIQYLGDDPHTRCIAIYMESVGNARAFLSAAREVALSKPIIVIKPGRTEAAAKAAASHTGALTGHDDVLDAAFRRCGVVRVDTIAELFYLAEALDKQPRPTGPNLTIITNAGGPAVLATDALLEAEGSLTALSPETIENLNRILPRHWSHQNPIDVLGDAGPDRFVRALEFAAKDPNTDGLLTILTPTGLTDSTAVAEAVAGAALPPGKPVIASWMGGEDVRKGVASLREKRIPAYSYPDSAARIFQLMWSYSANLKAIYETPTVAGEIMGLAAAAEIIKEVRSKGRTLLTEPESKRLLAAYSIPTVRTEIARNTEEAIETANTIGYPVVLKLHSETVTHKTDVGGVQLNIDGPAAVRGAFQKIEKSVSQSVGAEHFLGVTIQPMVRTEGYELILGSSIDSQFGPVMLFGSGGQLVEIYKDHAIGLPPLTTTLARRLIERTKIANALYGVRGRKPVDLAALERLLVRFSYLVAEQPSIKEIDINPLLASPDALLALDARVLLHPPHTTELPRLAIRPYPTQHTGSWSLHNGEQVTIRPIRPEDEPLMVRFHARLSERSVYQRYFHFVSLDSRTVHDRLVKSCFIDYDRQIALVAERQNPATHQADILAVARLVKDPTVNEAELAVIIEDEYQDQGLGTELSHRLIKFAQSERLDRITVNILTENRSMIDLCRRLGLQFAVPRDAIVEGHLSLLSEVG